MELQSLIIEMKICRTGSTNSFYINHGMRILSGRDFYWRNFYEAYSASLEDTSLPSHPISLPPTSCHSLCSISTFQHKGEIHLVGLTHHRTPLWQNIYRAHTIPRIPGSLQTLFYGIILFTVSSGRRQTI